MGWFKLPAGQFSDRKESERVTMTENEEIERYRKILEDWKPGPAPKGRTRPPAVSQTSASTSAVVSPAISAVRSAPVASSSPVGATSPAVGSYTPGAILKLNQRTVAVYRRAVPEKEYHLVLILCPNNAVKVQGVALEGYEVEEIGTLPPAWVDRLQAEQRWERDLIVFHCYRYEDVCKVPTADATEDFRMEPPSAHNAPAEQEATATQGAGTQTASVQTAAEGHPDKENGALRRGQRLQIKFGNNTWDAVYWGKDDQGQVIAHQTYERWSLMHLDLARFQNGLLVDPEVDMDLVRKIEQSIVNT
jgi:hypothetical protein